jgi:hypothetical protein
MKTREINKETYSMLFRNSMPIPPEVGAIISKYVIEPNNISRFYDYYAIKFGRHYFRIKQDHLELFLKIYTSSDSKTIYQEIENNNIEIFKNFSINRHLLSYIVSQDKDLYNLANDRLSKILPENVNN